MYAFTVLSLCSVMLFKMLIGGFPYERIPQLEGSLAFKYLLNKKLSKQATSSALDCLRKIFRGEKERITMEELLCHPFCDLAQSVIVPFGFHRNVSNGSSHLTLNALDWKRIINSERPQMKTKMYAERISLKRFQLGSFAALAFETVTWM